MVDAVEEHVRSVRERAPSADGATSKRWTAPSVRPCGSPSSTPTAWASRRHAVGSPGPRRWPMGRRLCCQLARATRSGRRAGAVRAVARCRSTYEPQPQPSAAGRLLCDVLRRARLVRGQLQGAEAHLRQALDQLRGTGHRARCGPPVAKLAELLVLQGRGGRRPARRRRPPTARSSLEPVSHWREVNRGRGWLRACPRPLRGARRPPRCRPRPSRPGRGHARQSARGGAGRSQGGPDRVRGRRGDPQPMRRRPSSGGGRGGDAAPRRRLRNRDRPPDDFRGPYDSPGGTSPQDRPDR